MSFSKLLYLSLFVLLQVIAVAAIVYSFFPLAQWYFNSNPLWGVDFYYLTTLVNLLKQSVVLPPANWGYAWFSGWPLFSIFPSLHVYAILPLLNYFFLLSAVKIWMIISLALFFIGCYACFFILSKNIAIALILSIAGIYSVGIYGGLMWGGSLPNFATQSFFPWTVFFIILYLRAINVRYLLCSVLMASLAIWGHSQIAIVYIIPTAGLLLIFSFGKAKIIKRIKALIVFSILTFILGLPLLYQSFGGFFNTFYIKDTNHTIASSTVKIEDLETAKGIAAFHRMQPKRIYIDTNRTIFIILGLSLLIFVLGFLVKRKLKMLYEVLPFFIIAIYFTFYIWIFGFGISFYHGGWYRLFWTPPFWLGLLASSLWGAVQIPLINNLSAKFKKVVLPVLVIISLGILILGYFAVLEFSKDIKEKIIARSNPSSAFPDSLSMHLDQAGFDKLNKYLVPDWLDTSQTNFRLYSGDQTVNIWWNAIYKMPLARGYFDPPGEKGYFFWLDASLSQETNTGKDQLVGSFNYPEDIAFNNTLFLIDWYALKYFEAGHAGPTVYAPIPKFLSTDQFIAKEQELDFDKERFSKGHETLNFYQMKDDYVTPILMATNAPTLGIVASDGGYETIVRDLADLNLNSRKIIPIKLGQNLDNLGNKDFAIMDALVLYDYKYKNKDRVFRLIKDYLESGKKVFVDTGVEVKESEDNGPLPEIFPAEKTYRKALGNSWDLEILDKDIGEGVDVSKFDPPIFDQSEWKLSFPQEEDAIRRNSYVMVRNKGKALMISQKIGKGEIIWSGLNLPYHVSRFHNREEIIFFKNIIERIVDISDKTLPAFETSFISPEHRIVKTTNASGILFKEQNYDGWGAKLNGDGKTFNAKIYKAGPANPGFMYIHIPNNFTSRTIAAELKFGGSKITWLYFVISAIFYIFVIDEVIFGKRALGKVRSSIVKKVYNKFNKWWKKEDED